MDRITPHQNSKIVWLLCTCFLLVLQGVGMGMDLPLTVIDHEGLDVFVSGYPLLLAARIENSSGIDLARCYFRYDPLQQYMFVEATREEDNRFTCMLPPPGEEVADLEYFFLVVDGKSRVIRSKNYPSVQHDPADKPPQDLALPHDFTVYVESEEVASLPKEELFDGEVAVISFAPEKRYGPYVGVYSDTARQDSRRQKGYFGGYFYDADRQTCFPVKGVSPFSDVRKAAAADNQRQSLGVGIVGPDISGDDWSGIFYTTGMNNRVRLTAKIIVTPWTSSYSKVDIITSKSGLGHSFTRGWIDARGNMLIYDDYDGEDWSTHWGPATPTRVRILDFVYPPSLQDPNPPKNVIELERSAPPEPESEPEPEPEPEEQRLDFLQSIFHLLLLPHSDS